MNSLIKTGMRVVVVVIIAFICVAGGCTEAEPPVKNLPPDTRTREERTQDQKERFEFMRQSHREFLSKMAASVPDKMGQASISLYDYELIPKYLEAFEEKYPKLKVTSTKVSILGGIHWQKIDPEIGLQKELERIFDEKRRRLEWDVHDAQYIKDSDGSKSAIAFSQGYLDALNAGNIRTYGFSIIGEIGDIEDMAHQEYGVKDGGVRVVILHADLNWTVPSAFHEPLYASDIGRGKREKPDTVGE